MDSLGFISIAVCWIGLMFLVKFWPTDLSMTFSQHAARYKSSRICYAVLWLIVLPPFYWFMMVPFADKLGLGVAYKITASIASALMLLAALIPETTGWKKRAHRISAFAMALLLIPVTIFILMGDTSSTARVVIILSLVIMLLGSINIAIKGNYQHPRMLLAQGSYVAVFHLSVLAAFYL